MTNFREKPASPEDILHTGGKEGPSMITAQEAAVIVKQNLIDCAINAVIPWEDNWLFAVYTSDADEGELDPFYAVNAKTGAFSGFSIVGDQDTSGIIEAFSEVIEHGDTSSGFLAHYGVKGMRWGVRKDPSSSGGKSGAKASGPSRTSKNLEKTLNITKPLLLPIVPRAAIIPKLVAVGQAASSGIPMKMAFKTAMASPAAIAGYAITGLDSGGYRIPVVAAKNLSRGGWNKDKSLSDPKLSVADLQSKVVSKINKDYPGLGTTNNCLRCTYTYEMRRRGYDVASTKTVFASGQTAIGTRVMTKSLGGATKIKNVNNPTGIKGLIVGRPPTAAQVFSTLAKQPDRSRGDLQMRWGTFLGGHSVAYEIVGGKPVIFDTQSGKTYSTPAELNKLTKMAVGLSFNRLDNKNLNATGITAWVKDA